MKTRAFLLLFALLTASGPAAAQSQASTHAHDPAVPASAAEAQAFEKLKTLGGSWVGQITTTPQVPGISGTFARIALKVTSRGNALAHEMSVSGLPDHPLTMFYVEQGRLTLTHYCDAGNRPRMTGKLSPDGKTLEFDFLDLSGGDDKGHMHRAVFTFIDENHHTEEWTYMMPGNVPMKAHVDLRRTNF